MTVLFDASVIVPALVDQLSNHPASFEIYRAYTTGRSRAVVSAHCLAECYSVLSSLPVPRRISSAEALRLIEESVVGRLQVVPLEESDYLHALALVSRLGLSGGIIYDALHAATARRTGCSRIYTYNVAHFRLVCPDGVTVSAP